MRLLLIVIAVFLLYGIGFAKSPVDLASFLEDKVTMIHGAGPNGKKGSCTAFAIRNDKQWGITAEHCARNSTFGFDYTMTDHKQRPLIVLARANRQDDLVLLQGAVFGELPELRALTVNPQVGQQVGTRGYADGYAPSFFNWATVARVHPAKHGFRFQTDKGVRRGMSGAPMINADGLVIGVVIRGEAEYTEMTGSWHFQELFNAAAAAEEAAKEEAAKAEQSH